MKELLNGFYATRVYLPFSAISRSWRRFGRSVRGKSDQSLQNIRLPEASWRDYVQDSFPRIWEHRRENGNVRISELAILSALSKQCRPSSNLFEIGTFDGRTTLNMALNAPLNCQIYTLDLPPNQVTKYDLAEGERHMVEKPAPGCRYESYRGSHPENVGRIHQLLGDSAAFDYTRYQNSCSLIFVDGSHAYNYARSDTRAARNLVEPGGMIVWHDYGIWRGVTDALEEMENEEALGLRNLRGTSLVVWRNN
jgi:predicted O-methyltransferase YrrM